MHTLTDLETPILRFGFEFTDPNLLVAIEEWEDTLGDGEASQPPTGSPDSARIGYIGGVCVGYRSNGSPVHIE